MKGLEAPKSLQREHCLSFVFVQAWGGGGVRKTFECASMSLESSVPLQWATEEAAL